MFSILKVRQNRRNAHARACTREGGEVHREQRANQRNAPQSPVPCQWGFSFCVYFSWCCLWDVLMLLPTPVSTPMPTSMAVPPVPVAMPVPAAATTPAATPIAMLPVLAPVSRTTAFFFLRKKEKKKKNKKGEKKRAGRRGRREKERKERRKEGA